MLKIAKPNIKAILLTTYCLNFTTQKNDIDLINFLIILFFSVQMIAIATLYIFYSMYSIVPNIC